MTSTLRSLAFTASAVLGSAAMAQLPYSWVVNGVVDGCYAGQTVDITVYDGDLVGPVLYTQNLVVDPLTCTFSTVIDLPVTSAYLTATTQCLGMVLTAGDSTVFNGLVDTAFTSITFDCGGGGTTDCNGVLNGPDMPGTPCVTFTGQMGTWDANCICVANTTACQASFTVQQATNNGVPVPWGITTTNSSTGAAPLSYTWWMPDGSASTDAEPSYVFNTEGIYGICLTITDGDGCSSYMCDTVYVDGDGNISTGNFFDLDCLGVINGPNLPGTGCTIPGTILQGIWSTNCVCEPNTGAPCNADFWVMQAYTTDSINPNGSGVPVPNVLWVWNLSSGGTGQFTYVWDFGDGETSTDAFPTHTYPGPGPYLLCLTIDDGLGCTDTYCDSISVDEDGMISGMAPGAEVRSTFTINVVNQLTTGVAEGNAPEVATWPNPVTDELNIQLTSSLRGVVNVDVLDLGGRVVRTGRQTLVNGPNRLSVPTSELIPGVYMLRIGSDQNSQVMRFVKTR